MEQQNTINQQISKEQQRNIYLSELLKGIQQKLSKATGSTSEKETVIENRAELQIAQMRNLDKKIEIYKHQLEKLKDLNTSKVILEVNSLKQQINKQWQTLNDVKKELKTLEEEVNGLTQKNASKQKNKQMEKMFKQREYQMKILAKKLKKLDNIEGNLNYKSPPKKSARSFTQIIKPKDNTLTHQAQTQDKKSKIDKFAMYKNLIRFYKLQEEKLKGEIQRLTKEQQENKGDRKKI